MWQRGEGQQGALVPVRATPSRWPSSLSLRCWRRAGETRKASRWKPNKQSRPVVRVLALPAVKRKKIRFRLQNRFGGARLCIRVSYKSCNELDPGRTCPPRTRYTPADRALSGAVALPSWPCSRWSPTLVERHQTVDPRPFDHLGVSFGSNR